MTTEPQSVLVSFPHLPYSSSGVVCLAVCVLLAYCDMCLYVNIYLM